MSAGPSYAVVIPTVGRRSLPVLLDSLAESATVTGRALPPVVLVDDRPDPATALELAGHRAAGWPITVLRSGGRGPAAARNAGWRACDSDWVAFLDDDVLVSPTWLAGLEHDLATASAAVSGSQGRIEVPLPADRRPRDWERGTAGLATAAWITADMAYRRSALLDCGGFDERFPRAFREDADLALRMLDRGWQLCRGDRRTVHPVRPAGWWASVHQQRGNADDVLMRRLHGRGWRRRAAAPLGRRPQHLLSTAAALAALTAAATGHRRPAALAGLVWAGNTAEFSWRRIAPGPRDRAEVLRMISTSVLIPPAASWFWLRALASRGTGRPGEPAADRPAAVLLDRDGTLVRDVPYNGDPAAVSPMPGARRALDRLRAAGIPVAVITNQSGIGRGLLSAAQVEAVNARIEALLGPFDGWFVCPHTDEAGCGCRKPAPGLIRQAAAELGVSAGNCVVIGDIGSDIGSAAAAGAASILVPTEQTRREEVAAAPLRAADLAEAVDLVLAGLR
ncbi:MAG TPA: HAD-IIIA family hydrolase [Jatrophihabitans sp.]|jgi:HAD superfamily hydrolase (TIGR01662 family)|uniref:HAD-IIIA family hydrolase n=1 Tax=Jatrophihabitans sp. TaxID=1932789 RepID=UPI002EF1B9E8